MTLWHKSSEVPLNPHQHLFIGNLYITKKSYYQRERTRLLPLLLSPIDSNSFHSEKCKSRYSRKNHGPAKCTYVCIYVCTYVCMYVCMYVRMYVCTYVWMYVCMDVPMYVSTSGTIAGPLSRKLSS